MSCARIKFKYINGFMSFSPNSIRKTLSYFLVITTITFFIGCKDKNDEPLPQANQYLVEAVTVGELSQQQIAGIANEVNPLLGSLVKSGVRLYKITYKTRNTDGSEIQASGAVAFPMGDQEYPMLSVQHGTITSEASAPSNFTSGNEFMQFGTVFGSLGYIAVFPDYIGYGDSRQFPHPYEHRETLGSASLDMLRAVKEFVEESDDLKWNKKLYISGFSEGGYATLSLQKKLEEEAKGEFDLRASTCGAGAYNKTEFTKYLINNETHGRGSYNRSYIWVLLSYNRIYKLNHPVSYFFREPYASQIEKDQHLAAPDGSFHEMLQPDFVEKVNNGTETGFINAVADNNLLDWKPVTPTQLYHGTADELVFYFNTKTAYESMIAKGATQVELKTLEGKDHATAVMDYLIGTYSFFSSKP